MLDVAKRNADAPRLGLFASHAFTPTPPTHPAPSQKLRPPPFRSSNETRGVRRSLLKVAKLAGGRRAAFLSGLVEPNARMPTPLLQRVVETGEELRFAGNTLVLVHQEQGWLGPRPVRFAPDLLEVLRLGCASGAPRAHIVRVCDAPLARLWFTFGAPLVRLWPA